MSRSPRKSLKELIAEDVVAALPPATETPVLTSPPEPMPAPAEAVPAAVTITEQAVPVVSLPGRAEPVRKAGKGTIRQRAKQLSVYLEDPVYEQLREIAFHERVKMHQLILEGIDLMLRKKGSPSIKELMKKAG